MAQNPMEEEKFIRARKPEQKSLRRQEILVAARAVALRDGTDALTLAGIAKETGITKSAFYRYFRSKEEILAWLLMSEAKTIAEDMRQALADCKNLVEAASAYVDLCAERPLFCKLASDMGANLEQNINLESLIAIKQESARQLEDWCNVLLDLDIVTDKMKAALFIRTAYVILAGLWPITNRSAIVRKASDQAGLDYAFISFRDEFHQILTSYARGLA